jgi:AraC-like DNA-binding protein
MLEWNKIEEGSHGLHFPGKSIILHSLISSVGRTRLDKHNYSFNGLEREKEEFVVFQYTLKGRGELIYEGENYALDKGSAMLVHIPHDHRYFFPENSREWEFVYLCFYGSEILRICRLAEMSLGPVFYPDRGGALIQKTYRIMKTVVNEINEPQAFIYSDLAYSWAMTLAGLISREKKGDEPISVKRARQFCRENLHLSIGVEDIARAARCSRSHLTRLFSAHTQMGLQEYLEYLRMQKASRLLHNRDFRVKEVARLCGYGDENYFCKVFKRNFNHSPGRYREIGL